ncbi:DUF4845 domain-containing protein [Legionella israelensis]|uniref:DUF4845 domain-containing protein n=1 Tax=Legionella israelensis TaxID=454 RepID=A0A0W0WBL7_9GAMM|nr:DUF4845 domain-containing protein [Legionella israelensis]KTD29754.1 transmembrane protein [Legionella israelensis]QBR83678.1 DUF4845 domain-containing protein [Legionella israelensis]QBS08879.1 DUF4845 domain-containing protein [Legionella israelensis]QDP73142.1 DUF4845 domain-containing protein [Legionella israelensis]SCY02925.1 protein of unknown function [Legionella israelensis DSM 19235]
MRKQHGMTLIGMLIIAAAVIILGIVLMRIVPVYIQHHSVISSVRSMNQLPPSEFGLSTEMNVHVLKKRLNHQFYVNGVDEVVKDGVQIKPEGMHTYVVTVNYQVTRPLVSNISLLFNFEDKIEVRIGKED